MKMKYIEKQQKKQISKKEKYHVKYIRNLIVATKSYKQV